MASVCLSQLPFTFSQILPSVYLRVRALGWVFGLLSGCAAVRYYLRVVGVPCARWGLHVYQLGTAGFGMGPDVHVALSS